MWNNLKVIFFTILVVPPVAVLMLMLFMTMALATVFLVNESLETFKVALRYDLNKVIG